MSLGVTPMGSDRNGVSITDGSISGCCLLRICGNLAEDG